jgi:hypothetical protein
VATETRVFESVDNSPETKAANKAYFDEQGVESNVEDSGAGEPNPPVTSAPAPAAAAPAEAKPGEGEAEEAVVDTETAADWESAQTDGKRKSRYAKKRQEARELKVANTELETKAQRLERENAELKAKLDGKPAGEPKPSDTAPPAAGSPPAAAAPEANAAEKFTEAEPVEPKYEDFAAAEDQLLEYQKALAKHGREWSRWDRRREKFEDSVAAKATEKANQAKTAREQRLAKLNESLAEIRTKHTDFDEVVKLGNVFTKALSGASTVVPGGLEAAYQLAKDPVKLKQFNELTAETTVVNGETVPTQRAWDLALYLLGQASSSPAPAASAPAGSPPAAIPSSSSQPREEPAAPRAARGRASDEPPRTDLSGDARRDRLAKELTH